MNTINYEVFIPQSHNIIAKACSCYPPSVIIEDRDVVRFYTGYEDMMYWDEIQKDELVSLIKEHIEDFLAKEIK